MASTPAKSKKPRNKPPKSRPAATSVLSQPAVEDASSSHTFSSFSPQGDLFAFLSLAVDKHRLRVYDTTTGQAVAEHVVDSARVSSISWAHYDSAAHDEGEPKRKRKRKNQQGDAASTKLPPPGIILGLSNGSLILYSPAHGKVVKSISHTLSTAAITWVAVDTTEGSETTHVWTSSADGVVRLWDLQEGSVVEQWKSDERVPYSCLSVRPQAEDESEDVELLGANYSIQLLLASRSTDLSGETRKLQKTSSFTGHASSVKALQWDSRSRFLSTAESDRFIYVWDVPETSGSEGKVAASIPLDSEVRATTLSTPPSSSPSTTSQTLLAVSASGRISVFPLPSNLAPSTPSKKSKVPTLLPKSTIVAASPKKGGDASRVQVIAAGFVSGTDGKVRIARLAGGVRPVFDVVDYLDAEGEFLPEISLAPVTAGAALRTGADATTTPQRYTESGSTAVRSGIDLGQDATMDDLATRDVEGELDADLAELSLGQRLTALTGADPTARRASDSDDEAGASKPAEKQADGPPLQTVPASSLTRTLIQALHSSDSGLLETCLAHTNATLIQNTVQRLPSQLAIPLITACVERLGRGKGAGRGKGGGAGAGAQRGTGLIRWVRAVLLVHGGHLLTMPDLVARLSGLHATLVSRLALQQSLLSLSGRLDLVISQIELRSSAAPAPLPVPQSAKSKGKQRKQPQKQVARYVEGESESEEVEGMDVEVESGDDAGSVEDVELGGSEEEEDEESEEEAEDSEEEEEEEEYDDEDDDSDVGGFKMNGFIDDEAEEYSDDDDEDESE